MLYKGTALIINARHYHGYVDSIRDTLIINHMDEHCVR